MNENNQNIEKAAQEYARNINPEMYHRKLDIDWLIEQLINFQTENQNGYIRSLVKRFGEVVAEKQKYKELYEKECKPMDADYGFWVREGDEVNSVLVAAMRCLDESKMVALRDALIERTPEIQKPITAEEIENLGEKEYPILWKDMSQNKHELFIKGFEAALKLTSSP